MSLLNKLIIITTQDYYPTKIKNLYYFFKDFIYLLMRHTERERQRHGQREKQAPRREPYMGLDPGLQDHTPGCRRRQTTVPPGLPFSVALKITYKTNTGAPGWLTG